MKVLWQTFFLLILPIALVAQLHPGERTLTKLQNPVTVQYLKKNLRKNSPRLVLTPSLEKQLLNKVKSDPVVSNVYKAMLLNADKIMGEPLVERKVEGRRLLAVSREML